MQKELTLEIKNIRDEIIALSSMVEEAMLDSAKALKDHDFQSSETILKKDAKINKKRFELEGLIISLIATRQPIAHDLRMLTAMLDMCTELERMGDYAKGLSTINLKAEGLDLPRILLDILNMAEKAVDMLNRAISSFVNEDVESAKAIAQEDNLIDALYREIYYEAMDIAIEDSRNIELVNFVLWSAHNIERFADRVTNICERTIFVVTGSLDELHLQDQHEEVRI
jgi:phosphate transport system protein